MSDYFNFSKCSLNIDVIIESHKGNNSKDYNSFIRKYEWKFCHLDNLDEYIWTNKRIIQQLRQRIPSEFVKDVPPRMAQQCYFFKFSEGNCVSFTQTPVFRGNSQIAYQTIYVTVYILNCLYIHVQFFGYLDKDNDKFTTILNLPTTMFLIC